jgi:hypothetical protein
MNDEPNIAGRLLKQKNCTDIGLIVSDIPESIAGSGYHQPMLASFISPPQLVINLFENSRIPLKLFHLFVRPMQNRVHSRSRDIIGGNGQCLFSLYTLTRIF